MYLRGSIPNFSVDWWIGWLVGGFIDWLIDWLLDWLIDWLIGINELQVIQPPWPILIPDRWVGHLKQPVSSDHVNSPSQEKVTSRITWLWVLKNPTNLTYPNKPKDHGWRFHLSTNFHPAPPGPNGSQRKPPTACCGCPPLVRHSSRPKWSLLPRPRPDNTEAEAPWLVGLNVPFSGWGDLQMAVVKWLRKVGGDGIREKSSQNLFQWVIGPWFVLVPYLMLWGPEVR